MARARGLIVRPDVATRLAEGCGANRDILANELDKFALYLDANPHAPQPLDHETVDALGADSEGGDLSRLVEGVADGDSDLLQADVSPCREGVNVVPEPGGPSADDCPRPTASRIERGNSVERHGVTGQVLFWKEKDAIKPRDAVASSLLAKSVGACRGRTSGQAPGSVGTVARRGTLRHLPPGARLR